MSKKNISKGVERDMIIDSLPYDIDKGLIKPISKAINRCFRAVKKL